MKGQLINMDKTTEIHNRFLIKEVFVFVFVLFLFVLFSILFCFVLLILFYFVLLCLFVFPSCYVHSRTRPILYVPVDIVLGMSAEPMLYPATYP